MRFIDLYPIQTVKNVTTSWVIKFSCNRKLPLISPLVIDPSTRTPPPPSPPQKWKELIYDVFKRTKRLSLHTSQVAHWARAYTGFSNMKWPGATSIPSREGILVNCKVTSPPHPTPRLLIFSGTHLYTWVMFLILNLRGLTRVFLRLNSARYHCLPDVSINRAYKNDAINPKMKRKPFQHLKGDKSLRYT